MRAERKSIVLESELMERFKEAKACEEKKVGYSITVPAFFVKLLEKWESKKSR